MEPLFAQLPYPMLLSMLWQFLLIASLFGLVVGVGLVTRSPLMLRACSVMNRWISMRRITKPLYVPHTSSRCC